ncbi:MAG: hypothetical protein V4679_14040 [Pseudomonadota bacterium]
MKGTISMPPSFDETRAGTSRSAAAWAAGGSVATRVSRHRALKKKYKKDDDRITRADPDGSKEKTARKTANCAAPPCHACEKTDKTGFDA